MLIPGVSVTEKAKIGTVGILYVPICAGDFTNVFKPLYMCCYCYTDKNPKKGSLLF